MGFCLSYSCFLIGKHTNTLRIEEWQHKWLVRCGGSWWTKVESSKYFFSIWLRIHRINYIFVHLAASAKASFNIFHSFDPILVPIPFNFFSSPSPRSSLYIGWWIGETRFQTFHSHTKMHTIECWKESTICVWDGGDADVEMGNCVFAPRNKKNVHQFLLSFQKIVWFICAREHWRKCVM